MSHPQSQPTALPMMVAFLKMCRLFSLSLFPEQYSITTVCTALTCTGIVSNPKGFKVYRRLYANTVSFYIKFGYLQWR
jgi:hypothetical protein